MARRSATHFKVIVVSRRSRPAKATFRWSPLARRRNSASLQPRRPPACPAPVEGAILHSSLPRTPARLSPPALSSLGGGGSILRPELRTQYSELRT
jgi:hypothetical protein